MSKRKSAYLAYLESGHWKSIRRQAFERDGFKCVRCGSTSRLQAHHMRYRRDFRMTVVGEVLTLCEPCHHALHRERARQRKLNRRPRRINHLVWLIGNFNAT